MPRTLAVVILAGVLCFAVPSRALVKFDFEQKYFTELGTEVKDHSLLRVDGVYHLFYLRGNPAVNIGHATSTDLIHWDLQPPILYTGPGTWDQWALWAPHIVRDGTNNTWVMYYTAVNRYGAQQTAMAVSFDLFDWIKIPWPVYHPDPSWALWSETVWSHGRDPFVFQNEGLYYQLLTAKTPANRGATACAVSSDGYTWQDNGPFYVHTNWHVFESVQVIPRNDKWYFFYTEETVDGTSYMKSDALFSGWNPSTAVVIDYGHAAEINQFDPGKDIFSRHSIHQYNDGTGQHVIRVDTLRWAGDSPYVYKPWPLSEQWTNLWGNAFLYAPTFLNNPAARGDTVTVGYEGYCWLSSYERYQGPLGIGTSGSYQGDSPTGAIRSKTFIISGNSMSLLVGGGYKPGVCYVALVDAFTRLPLYSETGNDTDEMSRRYWDLRAFKGKRAYIEICDNSSVAFGHISCDGIVESYDELSPDTLAGNNTTKGKKDTEFKVAGRDPALAPRLFQNMPNPFTPSTTIEYFLPSSGRVSLEVFDVSGALVRRLRDANDSGGPHAVTWDARNEAGDRVPSGVYFYRFLLDGRTIETRKMMLVK
jgi:hypothetical protein